MRRRAILTVLAAAMVLTACGSEEEPPDALGAPSHPPVVTAPAAPPRDTAAVLSALNRLDPCALLDPVAAGIPGFPADAERDRRSPHSCELERAGRYGSLTAVLGAPLNRQIRFQSATRVLDATVVYVQSSPDCRYLVPVGPRHAISFTADFAGGCAELDKLVPIALSRMDTPAEAGPAFAGRDACSVLAAALGEDDNTRLAPEPGVSGLDSCDATSTQATASSLRLRYAGDPARRYDDRPTSQLNERTVYRDDDCELVWSQGPSGLPGESQAFATVEARTTCDRLDPLATEVMRVLGAPPAAVPPVSPLRYPPGETGLPDTSPCADVTPEQPCRPSAHQPYAPHDPAALASTAAADPGVLCGLAEEAVRAQFGPELRPVVSTVGNAPRAEGCLFVEPSLRRQVTVAVTVESPSTTDGQPVTIAGRPGWARVTPADDRHTRLVTLTENENTVQRLEIGLRFNHERGSTPDPDQPIGTPGLEKLDALAGDIASRAF
ncbi:hypothetical protein [Amycolatopsis sp. 195334CR]|uniref:hypothetical protein n=1 Tax=Amycolatopsis sp. 195334CR TaxID=2814588 RepID=UPI001A8C7327|nr:hypothetical protein [Amycolatopsis sp. 195334CR]MBN6040208.1 hypothetical protein [Amycolatopsis sp. 195334CR]